MWWHVLLLQAALHHAQTHLQDTPCCCCCTFSTPLWPPQASPKDYMEWLSDQTAIPLQKLLLDNVERVKDIGSIGGITLLLCNPDASE
jgi:hypothetical protein